MSTYIEQTLCHMTRPLQDKETLLSLYRKSYTEAYDYDETKTYELKEKHRFILYDYGNFQILSMEEVYTDEELKPLEKYCECPSCKAPWYKKCYYYGGLIGCIKQGTDYVDPFYVKKALERISHEG